MFDDLAGLARGFRSDTRNPLSIDLGGFGNIAAESFCLQSAAAASMTHKHVGRSGALPDAETDQDRS